MDQLIFVCTGNTCRSPMAEALGKKYLSDGLFITSRGLTVSYGQSANIKAIIAMDMEGLDIRSHQAKQFDIGEVTDETLILAMTRSHQDFLVAYYPELKGQVFTLLTFAQMKGEVKDPFGAGQDTYNQCAKLLKKAIIKINDTNKLERFKKGAVKEGERYDSDWM